MCYRLPWQHEGRLLTAAQDTQEAFFLVQKNVGFLVLRQQFVWGFRLMVAKGNKKVLIAGSFRDSVT
jgi:hypothetical protein